MLITLDWLKQHHACQHGIDWYERNFKQPIDTDKIEIIGDYNDYFRWIKITLKCKHEYDDKNNRIKEIDSDGDVWQYEYDDRNNRIKIIFSNSNIIQYEYDNRNNLIKEIRPNNDKYQYEYDNKSNCIKEIYPNGDICEYEYDNKSNPIKKTCPNMMIKITGLK
jgi:YD repeat-containing protein